MNLVSVQMGRDHWAFWIKRAMDITLGAIALAILSPLMMIVAVAISLDDGWPVLYEWNVVGRGGRPFRSYKFRTMVRGADDLKASLADRNEMTGPVFKVRDDPRVTRLGNFLRRTSIDELPQLWSVIGGSMSLVGPRPPLQSEYENFTAEQRRKLEVTPGITCLWQIRGRNDISSFEQWLQMDREYIENWSLALDIKILVLTIPAVLFRRGAA